MENNKKEFLVTRCWNDNNIPLSIIPDQIKYVLYERTVMLDEVDRLDRPFAYISDEGDVSAWTGLDCKGDENSHLDGEK